ncbi:IspD/TarI family cytidylyltransferase [Nocardioides antri]|uniref:2-C-methyl-D-erythritol 4-phosphate cytidylyltransferase n=1 Tax=Nocardioides antri TaxID=2607659 RepID=A0A5B1M3D5_9ACTN|nr:IspD/TarI family cytidylyltransferase [Nocardioides antri]KAA1427413.1 2-C-methyl-D-erythritol 4-phosphate cytidylyltransferase [Nocardioides antri]
MTAAVVILAAGSGSRVGAEVNKVLLPLDGLPVLAHSVRTVLTVPGLDPVVVVCRPGEESEVGTALTPHLGARDVLLVPGGTTRHGSEQAALAVLTPRIEQGEVDVVVIHDGARALAPAGLFEQVVDTAREAGGAVPTVELAGLLTRDPTAAPPRGRLVGVQTPQAFRAAPLLDAYRAAARDGFDGTDTAACLERYQPELAIRAVPAGPANLKVTYPEDLEAASRLSSAG